jgi:hypothetical protein
MRPIKYNRFNETHNKESLQKFFDDLIIGGWNIIYYDEMKMIDEMINITVIAAKYNYGDEKLLLF